MASSEIICISSDEEEEPPQKYARNKQTVPFEKHVQTKQEIVHNMEESVSRPKRKASQMENNNTTPTRQENSYDKKMRLSTVEVQALYVCDEVHVDATNAVKKQPDIEEKPKLIVKEKISISETEQDIFPMFISLCLQKDKDDDMKTIVNKLKRRYEQLDPAYVSSEEFINFLNEKRNAIMSTSNKLYVHICEVMNEMKSKSKCRPYLQNMKMANGKKCDTVTAHSDSTGVASVSSSNRGNNATNSDHENYDTESTDNDKKVKLIIRTMSKCERVIKKLEEEEVSFVDEQDSSYMKLEKYKHRMVELYNKLCEYTGDNPDAGRPYLRPKHFSTTRIVAVDQAITSFINSNISKRNHLKKIGAFTDGLIFPDYRDILECVKRCNDSHNLGLDKKKQLQIAKEAFTELGQHLQRVRQDDYWDTFSLNLENKAEDPAVKDKDLAVKLSENRRIGNERLAQVFEEFTKKQQEMNNQPADGNNTSEDEEETSSAEDEENKSSNHNISDSDSQGDTSTDEDKSVKNVENIDMDTDSKNKEGQKVGENKARVAESILQDDNENTPVNDTNTLHGEYVRITQSTNSLEVVEVIEDKDTEINKVTAEDNTMYTSTSTKPALEIKPEKTVKTSTTPTSTKETEDDVADIVSENLKLHERIEEKQPALRVCSFAKSPTTWDDSQQKIGKPEQAALSVKQDSHTEQGKETTDVIDLTKEISNQGVKLGTVQFRNTIVSVNGKYKTLRLPANVANSISCLKNIKCTKLTKVGGSNIQDAQVVSTLQRLVSISGASAIIAIPTMAIASSTQQKTASSISTPKLSRTPIVTSSIQPNTSSNAGNTKQITAAKNIQQKQKAIYVQVLKKTDTNEKSKDPNKLNSKSC